MAEPAAVEVVPQPIGVGGEMEALRRFFPAVVTWEGTIHEGGMGSGTPAMRGIGRGTATVIQDGRWIAGDYEQDQLLDDGTFVLRWQLHWVAGWARRHRGPPPPHLGRLRPGRHQVAERGDHRRRVVVRHRGVPHRAGVGGETGVPGNTAHYDDRAILSGHLGSLR
jgi:hypothetical protein